jgi:hypothetical protein
MRLTYDKRGNCTRCGLPGSGFVEDGVCMCGDGDGDVTRDIRAGTDQVTRAKQLIGQAEAQLGNLSNGQCRDLLKDNTAWSSEEVRLIVQFLRGDD